MIGGGVVVSDDSLLALPIFNEVPEQRFAPCWIEVECYLPGLGGSQVIGELSEQGFALFRINSLLRS